jgi:hypothetical protein
MTETGEVVIRGPFILVNHLQLLVLLHQLLQVSMIMIILPQLNLQDNKNSTMKGNNSQRSTTVYIATSNVKQQTDNIQGRHGTHHPPHHNVHLVIFGMGRRSTVRIVARRNPVECRILTTDAIRIMEEATDLPAGVY